QTTMTAVPQSFRIALAQYPIEFQTDFAAYANKLEQWVAEAASQQARLLLFPEYGSMELVSLLPEVTRTDLQASLEGMAAYWQDFEQLHLSLAARYQVYILAASFPRDRKNVAAFYSPHGKLGEQEKNIMTRFEREVWHIHAGQSIQ